MKMKTGILINPRLLIPYVMAKRNERTGDHSFAYYPKKIYLIINNVCNAKCIMCDIGLKNKESAFYKNLAQDGKNTLDIPTLQRLVNEIKFFKPRIHINGVEPLLFGEIIEAVRIIKKAGLRVQIITNGILLEKYAFDLVKLGVDSITLSIDGLSEVHNRIRGEGVFERAMAGLRQVQRYRRELNRKKPKLKINYTISNLNTDSIYETVARMVDEEHVDAISLQHMSYVTDVMSEKHNLKFRHIGEATPMCTKVMDPSQMQIDRVWAQLNKVKDHYGHDRRVHIIPDLSTQAEVSQYYNNPEVHVTGKPCRLPWIATTVQPDGNLIIRSRCFTFNAGNIHNDSFLDIWNGERYRLFRRELSKNGLYPVCTRCCGIM